MPARLRTSLALVSAGFRRYSTYRQATLAGAVANVTFGFLRCYVLLSVAGTAGTVVGYDPAKLATYCWLGQCMLAVVGHWGMLDLAERVRTGDVVADLLRPIDPLWTYLCAELGRAGFAMLTRFVAPLAAGLLAFRLFLPTRAVTYLLFAVSLLLAVLIGFLCRYLIGLSAFWLLDVRGVTMMWTVLSGAGSGLYVPIALYPEVLSVGLWVATPFPHLLQATTDIVVERGGTGHGLVLVGAQLTWVAVLTAAARLVQARALTRLVIQGG